MYDTDTMQDIYDELRIFCSDSIEVLEFWNWIRQNGWTPYDSLDKWLKGRRVLLTQDLYNEFKK